MDINGLKMNKQYATDVSRDIRIVRFSMEEKVRSNYGSRG